MTGYTRKVGLRKPQPRRTYGGYDYFNAPSQGTIADTQGRYVINMLNSPEQVFTELQWKARRGSL